MSDQRRVWEVVEALDDLGAEERERELERLACEDRALADEVRSLMPQPGSGFLRERPVSLREALIGERGESSREPQPGDVLDEKYRLHEIIGSGSMGVVYRGEHVQLKKALAVKLLRISARATQERLTAMVAEASAVAAVRHENV